MSTYLLKRLIIGLLIFFALYTVVGFFVLPPVLKPVLEGKLSEALHRPVAIRDIDINPYVLSIRVKGLAIKDREVQRTFVSCEDLYLNLQSFSLVKSGYIIKELFLRRPQFNLTRHPDGSYNFSDLVQARNEKGRLLPLSINNIQVINGGISFQDDVKHTETKVTDISLGIPFLSNLPYDTDIFVYPVLSARINGTPFSLSGRTKPFSTSHETILNINIKDLNIPRYLSYSPEPLHFKVEKGSLNAAMTLYYSQYKDKPPSLKLSGDLSVKNLSMKTEMDEPLLTLPLLNLSTSSAELFSRKIQLSRVDIQEPEFHLRRDREGSFDLGNLFSRPGQPSKTSEEAGEKAPWLLTAEKIQVKDGKLHFADFSPPHPLRVAAEGLQLAIEEFSTAENAKSQVSCSLRTGEKGSGSLTGWASVRPAWANLKMSLKEIDLSPIQSYLEDKVNVVLTGGNLSVEGTFEGAHERDRGFYGSYKGDALISNFSSKDRVTKQDLVKWKSLSSKKIDISFQPLSLGLQDVALTDYYARIVIHKDGRLNLQEVLRPKPGKSKRTPTDSSKKITMDTMTLQGGEIDFSDHHIMPPYSAKLLDVGGRISGLSSQENTAADVDLQGKINKYAPIEITGKINPLRKDLYVDLKGSVKGMDMTPLNPYSTRYVGYTVEKGKLFLEMKYLIVREKLDAANDALLDQLSLGNRVESPQATTLPLKLAIALLKNRKGEIYLNIPVSGRLDDPQFSFGDAVLNVLKNLLLKAAQAPFTLLASVLGGNSEEYRYVEFPYGSADLSTESKQKLDALIKALYERPEVKLDVKGMADREKDGEALKKNRLEEMLKREKLKAVTKKGLPEPPLHEITLSPEEYDIYIERVYEAQPFPKPKEPSGIPKALPSSEREMLILTHLQITEQDLVRLASRRASTTRAYILESQKVEPDRLFLREPALIAPERSESRGSRVEFILEG